MWFAVLLLGYGCAGQHLGGKRKITSLKELRTKNMILQQHEYTCGAAALATMMNLVGDTSYTEVDVLKSLEGTRVKKKGEIPALSVAHLKKASRSFGFKVVAFKTSKDELGTRVINALKPLITRLLIEEDYAHFVVVRDVRQGWVYVSDPAYGNFRITWESFVNFWQKGDNVFVSISKQNFKAWKKEDGSLVVKRADTEKVPLPQTVSLWNLHRSPLHTIPDLSPGLMQ